MSKAPGVSARTKQDAESQHQRDWNWVETSIWTPRMLTALENGVKGGKWFSLIDKITSATTLHSAWTKVRRKGGKAAGVDKQGIEHVAAKAETYLQELEEALKTGTYRPQAVRRVELPKDGGGVRPLGIPTVKDRVVQTAAKLALEPIFEHLFLPCSYGFRPGRSGKDALRDVNQKLQAGYHWVVDADLQGYFDSIPHDRLMERVSEQISDGRVLELLRSWLKQDVLHGMKRWTPTGGSPQGAVISPLLANIYLHPLDALLTNKGYQMVRYADDFVVLCRSQQEAEQALTLIREWVSDNGLTLHPDKTHIGNCLETGQGFDFLGYRFEAGRRWVRKKSMQRLKDKIRSKTGRSRGNSLACIIADLNPMLRGWFNYFKHARRTTFRAIDGFVRRRLRAILRRQNKRSGFGYCLNDHKRWPNAFFAERGLFTLTTAHAKASQSRS